MKYVVLLRGVNVGGNKRVEMSKLKKAFEDAEYENVSTYINSGNVIFESKRKVSATELEKLLNKTFGFEIAIIIRDASNIQKLCKAISSAWTNDDDQKTDICFLGDAYDSEESIGYLKLNADVDRVKYIDGALVWNIHRTDYAKSGMHTFIGTPLYKNMTARNVNTVRKLGELMKG
jgi:uncharacterized protein (DUF1697 family)